MTVRSILSGDALTSPAEYKTRLAANPVYSGLDSLETVRVYDDNLGAGAATLYTCPAIKRARLGGGMVFLHNPTGGAITADLHHVPSGGSTATTNKLAATVTVAAGESRLYFDKSIRQVMSGGDSLVINTGGAGLNAWLVALEERAAICAFVGGFRGDLPASETTILTVPATHTFALENLVVYNAAGAGRVLTVHARESGVSAGTTNQIENQTVGNGAGFTLDTGLMVTLSEGGLVSGLGDNTGMNVWCSGVLL
jgi:hypothetical protein